MTPDPTVTVPASVTRSPGRDDGSPPARAARTVSPAVDARVARAVERYCHPAGAGLVLPGTPGWQPKGLGGLPLLSDDEADWEALATRREFPRNGAAIGGNANDPRHGAPARERLRQVMSDLSGLLGVVVEFGADDSDDEDWLDRLLDDSGDAPALECHAHFDDAGAVVGVDDLAAIECLEMGAWSLTRAELRDVAEVFVAHGFPAYVISFLSGDYPTGILRVLVRGVGDEHELLLAENGIYAAPGKWHWTARDLMRWQDAVGQPYRGGNNPPWSGGLAGVEITEIAAWREQHGPLPWHMPGALMLLSAARVLGRCEPVAALPGHGLRFADERGRVWELSAAGLDLHPLGEQRVGVASNVLAENVAALLQATGLRSIGERWLLATIVHLAGMTAAEAAKYAVSADGDPALAQQLVSERLRACGRALRDLRELPDYT